MLDKFQLQLNNSGQIALGGPEGILRSNQNSLEDVAYYGKVISNDIGRVTRIRYFQMNESGDVAFLSGITGNPEYYSGLFVADGDGDVRVLVRSGQTAPDGDGELDLRYIQSFAFNDAGQIAFVANVINAQPTAYDGLFLYDPNEGIIQVARTGEEYLGRVIQGLTIETGDADNLKGLNNRGQIAYRFELNDQTQGIALWTPVPEPSSVVILVAMVVALCLMVRSRQIA